MSFRGYFHSHSSSKLLDGGHSWQSLAHPSGCLYSKRWLSSLRTKSNWYNFVNRSEKDLKTLSELGHFLKGSSATLGLIKVRDGCEKIQRYGKNENLDGSSEPDSELCLTRIKEALKTVKTDYQDVERRLKAYYDKGEGKDDDA